MDIFSLKGWNKIEQLSNILEKDKPVHLRVDVDGESFFLTNPYLNQIENITNDCGFDANFTLSLHQNETALPIILNPLEDISSEFMDWYCSKLALNVCSVRLAENHTLTYKQFKELSDNRLNNERTLLNHHFVIPSISANPLL